MKIEVIGVKFNESSKVFHFSPNGLKLSKDDTVVVQTIRGEEVALVSSSIKTISADELVGELKNVARLATPRDIAASVKNIEDCKRLLSQAKDIASNMCPTMKVSKLEYILDRSKMVVTYISDERVDYRELVKKLATHFRTRIEMRQVGNRDEVAIIGAMGPCGQECCCRKFLSDFDKVSIKMAKQQGIALNPNKINGMCGRLLCCLKYEDEFYNEVISRMPKVGSFVSTDDGEGKVVYNDILGEKVTVQFIDGDGFKRVEYPIDKVSAKRDK